VSWQDQQPAFAHRSTRASAWQCRGVRRGHRRLLAGGPSPVTRPDEYSSPLKLAQFQDPHIARDEDSFLL